MAMLWSNNSSTTIAGPVATTSTQIQLATGTGTLFPSPTGGDYFCITLYDAATKTINEILHCTARSGDTLTVTRAQEGTTAQVWNPGDIAANLVTAGTLANFVQIGPPVADTSRVYVGVDVSTTPNQITVPNIIPQQPQALAVGMMFNILVKNRNTTTTMLSLGTFGNFEATRTDGSHMIGGNVNPTEEMIFIWNGVNFTSMVPPVPVQPPVTTFYVNETTGSDTNDGMTPQTAFRTISGGMYNVHSQYISSRTITMIVADGIYVDCVGASDSYIASWNLVGNTSNPGNCQIISTSTNQGAYPPYAAAAGACVGVSGPAKVSMNGFSFESYLENIGATNGGSLTIYNCAFSAPTIAGAGGVYAMIVESGASIDIYGNCSYNSSAPCPAIFVGANNGTISIGYKDAITTIGCNFYIYGNYQLTGSTALAAAAGNIIVWNGATNIYGAFTPNVPQFVCTAGGGITFVGYTSSAGVFPGAQSGVVVPPGWTYTS